MSTPAWIMAAESRCHPPSSRCDSTLGFGMNEADDRAAAGGEGVLAHRVSAVERQDGGRVSPTLRDAGFVLTVAYGESCYSRKIIFNESVSPGGAVSGGVVVTEHL